MKPKDKELLLKDLCARLPYGVIMTNIELRKTHYPLTCGDLHDAMFDDDWDDVPYLRPMSSMTEEEKKEYIEYAGYEIEESVNGRHYEYYLKDFCGTPDNPSVNTNGVDWLNEHHFDYRGLIEKGLAIEVTDDNNPYKD